MGFMLRCKFRNVVGAPSRGFAMVRASYPDDVGAEGVRVGAAVPVYFDAQGWLIVDDLPSGPAGTRIGIRPVISGAPLMGEVIIPVHPDGSVVDLSSLVTRWPGYNEMPTCPTTGTGTTTTTPPGPTSPVSWADAGDGTAVITYIESPDFVYVDNADGTGSLTVTETANMTLVDNGDGTAVLTYTD